MTVPVYHNQGQYKQIEGGLLDGERIIAVYVLHYAG
jgi:hypothetical protein